MKLKSAVKYQLSDSVKPLFIFYSVIYAIIVCIFLLSRMKTDGKVSFGGIESASMVFIFIAGLNSFKSQFRMFLQNGLSRKTLFKSIVISMIYIALFMAVVDSLNGVIAGNIMTYQPAFEQFYGQRYNNSGDLLKFLDGLIWFLSAYLFLAMAGLFITTLYYRMNKWQKLSVSVGVPIFFIIILPTVDQTITNGSIARGIKEFFSFAWGYQNGYNPYYSVLTCTVFSVMLGVLSYLLVKKAIAKD